MRATEASTPSAADSGASASSPIVVAISSRALFDLEDSHEVYASRGVGEYRRYQVEREKDTLEPGIAFPLVGKLLALNEIPPEPPSPPSRRVEVVLLSRNSADTGLRIFNSIAHHGLDITRAAFAGGQSPYPYAAGFGAHLFLSADAADVRGALDAGIAASTIVPAPTARSRSGQLRIAFDGDAVLFSDEAERVFRSHGLEAFAEHERAAADTPLPGGPFRGFLAALQTLQASLPAEDCPLRTALVTARGAPAHERVIRTLRAWEVRIDEALFLGGLDKAAFLAGFGADIFFDDQRRNVDSVPGAGGHVPYGVANEQGPTGS